MVKMIFVVVVAVLVVIPMFVSCASSTQTPPPVAVDSQPVKPSAPAVDDNKVVQPTPVDATARQVKGFVYRGPNTQTYYMKESLQDMVNLTKGGESSNQPAWSPDGNTIAFISDRDGEIYNQVFAMDVDGNNVRKLATVGLGAQQPVWSPDSTRIAFVSNYGWPEPNATNSRYAANAIYVMNYDGTNLANITEGKEILDDCLNFSPMWSPDGRKLVFISLKIGHRYTDDRKKSMATFAEKYPDIFVINADGTGLITLTRNEPPIENNLADKSFAEISAKKSTADTPHESYISPAWSPDGKTIAFLSNREGGYSLNDYWQIYMMNDAGKDQERLGALDIIGRMGTSRNYPTLSTFDTDYETYGPFLYWSPDANYIAVSAGVAQIDMTNDRNVNVLDTRDGKLVFSQIAGRSTLCWSPDSKKIAFVPHTGTPNPRIPFAKNLLIVNYDGSEPQTIFDCKVDGYLNWHP